MVGFVIETFCRTDTYRNVLPISRLPAVLFWWRSRYVRALKNLVKVDDESFLTILFLGLHPRFQNYLHHYPELICFWQGVCPDWSTDLSCSKFFVQSSYQLYFRSFSRNLVNGVLTFSNQTHIFGKRYIISESFEVHVGYWPLFGYWVQQGCFVSFVIIECAIQTANLSRFFSRWLLNKFIFRLYPLFKLFVLLNLIHTKKWKHSMVCILICEWFDWMLTFFNEP